MWLYRCVRNSLTPFPPSSTKRRSNPIITTVENAQNEHCNWKWNVVLSALCLSEVKLLLHALILLWIRNFKRGEKGTNRCKNPKSYQAGVMICNTVKPVYYDVHWEFSIRINRLSEYTMLNLYKTELMSYRICQWKQSYTSQTKDLCVNVGIRFLKMMTPHASVIHTIFNIFRKLLNEQDYKRQGY